MKCNVCQDNVELRLGVCFRCAECESIIEDGTDMDDKVVARTSMEKLIAVVKRVKMRR